MKRTFIYTALTAILALTLGNFQELQATTQIQKNDSVYGIVDTPPTFVGGNAAMYKYLSETLVYPVSAQENSIQGKVLVQFVVDETGKVLNPKVIRGIDPSLDAEAIRVINAMPKWNPGLLDGKAVKVRYTIPISFSLVNGSTTANANKQAIINDGKQHIATSKGLVGMWRQAGALDNSGKIVEVQSGNYKVINSDGTFYTFIAWGGTRPTQISLYGTYTITSDSTYSEKIVQHGFVPKMNGTTSELRYKLIETNTLLIEFKNEALGTWIPEIWKRVELVNLRQNEEKTI